MNFKFFIMILVLPVLFSCQKGERQTAHVIEIDINQNYISELPALSITSVVPLQTHDYALFGPISAIKYFSDRLYLLDVYTSKSLLVFSKNGNFINKTKFGKGLQGLLDPFAFFVDQDKNNIMVYDQTLMYIFKYDLDLNFLSKEKYYGVPLLDFTKPNEGELLVRSHFTEDYAFTLYSSDYSIKKQFVVSNFKGAQSLLNAVSSTNRRTLLISSFDYHIYEWMGDDVYRQYYLDFGQYKISNSDIERHSHTAIWNLIKSGQKVSSPMAIAESDSFLLFYVVYLHEPVYYIYSLNKEVIYRLNDYYVTQTLPKCSMIGAIEDDVFYALVEPEDMMYFQKETKSEWINIENDATANPFLITFAISDT